MKTLKQIQRENRKAILKEIKRHELLGDLQNEIGLAGCLDEEGDVFDNIDKKATLSDNDLVTSQDELIGVNKIIQVFSCIGSLGGGDYSHELWFDIEGNDIFWDLTKETLEEQSEETQRAVHNIITENK